MTRYIIHYPKMKYFPSLGTHEVIKAKSKETAISKFKRNSLGYKFQPKKNKRFTVKKLI